MKTIVFTSDKTSWALRAFAYQWAKYAAGLPFEAAGYTMPAKGLKGYPFHSIGKFEDYPVHKWSDGVIQFLESIPDDLVLILLDDYWLIRRVDLDAIELAELYMQSHQDVVRFCLTTDRQYDRWIDIGAMGRVDLIQSAREATYGFSFQASIWRKELLLQLLEPGETPWEAEIRGNERLQATSFRVVGTMQWPIKYMIAINKGQLAMDGSWCVPPRQLKSIDFDELSNLGYLHE